MRRPHFLSVRLSEEEWKQYENLTAWYLEVDPYDLPSESKMFRMLLAKLSKSVRLS